MLLFLRYLVKQHHSCFVALAQVGSARAAIVSVAFCSFLWLMAGLGLLALMSALGQTWNIVSIAAVPLTLGLGLDFTIHMIYSLRRRSQPGGGTTTGIGRALAYCGLSTGLGFGSLALAGNQGLVSLGVCAMIGVLCTLISAAFVLPWAWRMWPPKPAALADPGNE